MTSSGIYAVSIIGGWIEVRRASLRHLLTKQILATCYIVIA